MSDPLGVKTQRLQLNYPLGVISGSPDGKLAVVGGRDVLKVVSITKDQVKETINLRSGSKINLNGLTDAKWGTAPCPQSIASAHQDGTIVLWDLDRGVNKQSYTINEHERGAINRICFHPTEEMFVSASHDGSLKVWDPRTKAGQRSTYQPKAGPARDVQFNPTGSNEFIAAFEHGDVQVWDLRVSTEPRQRWGTHSLVLTVDWHPDGRLFASAGRDKLIKVWDSRSDSRKHQAQIQTMSQISRIAWRPALYGGTTTQQIASCSLSGDPRVLVWDLSRPFIPECAVEEHLGDVTDFLWTTSYNIWSVSKDQTVISQDVGVVGYRPVKLLNPAVAKWSVFGEVTFSVPDRQEDRDSSSLLAPSPIAPSLPIPEKRAAGLIARRATRTPPPPMSSYMSSPLLQMPLVNSFVNKQFTGLFDPQLFDYVSFMRLAWLYHLTPSTASDVCEQNELVAASEQSSDNSQAWATLQLIFGREQIKSRNLTRILGSSSPLKEVSAVRGLLHGSFDQPQAVGKSKRERHDRHNQSIFSLNTRSSPQPESSLLSAVLANAASWETPGEVDEMSDYSESPSESGSSDDENDFALQLSDLRSSLLQLKRLNGAAGRGRLSLSRARRSSQESVFSPGESDVQSLFTLPGGESDDDGDEDFDDDDESSLSLDAPSAYANSRRSLFKFLSFDRSADRRPDGRSIVLHDLIDPTGQPVPVVHSPTPMTPAPRDMVSADFLVPTLDGEDMFRTILEYFAEQGNVQMCATIVLALRDYIDVPIETQEQWVWNYVDLLRRMQLWIPATAVLKESAHLPLTGTRNQNSTTIHTMCSTCGKAISAAPAAGWCCERCHTTVKCSLCRKTVFGQFTWCHGCSHGGHLTCLQEWFSENSQCSAGCGHACTL